MFLDHYSQTIWFSESKIWHRSLQSLFHKKGQGCIKRWNLFFILIGWLKLAGNSNHLTIYSSFLSQRTKYGINHCSSCSIRKGRVVLKGDISSSVLIGWLKVGGKFKLFIHLSFLSLSDNKIWHRSLQFLFYKKGKAYCKRWNEVLYFDWLVKIGGKFKLFIHPTLFSLSDSKIWQRSLQCLFYNGCF